MKTVLYYFSGTGNCLALARRLAHGLEGALLKPIGLFRGGAALDDDIVGIIFPVYYQDMPRVVKEFVANSTFKKNSYIFGVSTYGEMAGFAIGELEAMLKARDASLASGFTVRMPGNYNVLVDLVTPPEKQQVMLEASYKRADEIAALVKERVVATPENPGGRKERMAGAISGFVHRKLYKLGSKFKLDGRCNGCGICEKVCPMGNIEVDNAVVSWKNSCEHCLACSNYCPQGVIVNGKRRKGRIGYKNPDVEVKSMYRECR